MKQSSDREFVDRLRSAVSYYGKLKDFIHACDIPHTTFRHYLNGGDPSRRNLVKIAETAKVNVEWLVTGRGSIYAENDKRVKFTPNEEAGFRARLSELLRAYTTEGPNRTEISNERLVNLVSGAEPSIAELVRMGAGFGISLSYLLTGHTDGTIAAMPLRDGRKPTSDKPEPGVGEEDDVVSEHEWIHIVPLEHRALGPKPAGPIDRHIFFAFHLKYIDRQLRVSPGMLRYMISRDSDMEPTIRRGEVVVMDIGDPLSANGIYVLRLGNLITIKRVQFVGRNRAEVRADGPGYRPWLIEDPIMNTDVQFMGRVIWWTKTDVG